MNRHRTTCLLALLMATSLGLVSYAQTGTEAFYECVGKDGLTVLVNAKAVPRYKKQRGMKCTLLFNAGPTSAAKKSAGRSAKTYRPPTAGEPKSDAVEPKNTEDRMALYQAYVEEASERYRIPQAFIQAVIRVESHFKYQAVSSAGAQGLMQLMPGTARDMGVRDPFDPRQNIMGGARLLRVLANRFDGDIVKVLSGYHAGAGAVLKKGGIPYQDTEGYVRAVLDHYYRYKALGPAE